MLREMVKAGLSLFALGDGQVVIVQARALDAKTAEAWFRSGLIAARHLDFTAGPARAAPDDGWPFRGHRTLAQVMDDERRAASQGAPVPDPLEPEPAA